VEGKSRRREGRGEKGLKMTVEMLSFLSLCSDDNDTTTDNITPDTPGQHGSLDCQPIAHLESKTWSVERLPYTYSHNQ